MSLTHLQRSASTWTSYPTNPVSVCCSRSLSTVSRKQTPSLCRPALPITTTPASSSAPCLSRSSTGAASSSSLSCLYRSSGVVRARPLSTLSSSTTRLSAQAHWQYSHHQKDRHAAQSGLSFFGKPRNFSSRYPASSSTCRSFPHSSLLVERQQQQQLQKQKQQCGRCYSHLTAAVESNSACSANSSTRSMMPAPSTSSASKSAASGLHSTAFPIQATTGSVNRMSPAMTFTPATNSPRRRYSPQHFYQNRILDPYVQQTVTPITLRQLVFFGRNMQPEKLLKSANYVRTELPVRLAHRIRDFQNLPFIVGTNPHIELVYDLYWQAFERLRKVPEIKTLEDNDKFCELVKELLNDHLVVIPQLALGIMECSKHIPSEQIDQFMNKMLRSRISRRVLAEQHISLTANYNSPNHMMADRGYIGIIYTHCSPRDIVERTALLAAETCRQAIGGGIEPPKVILDGNIDAEFSYIPDHIEYILYELLKNSMRFVMLRNDPHPQTGELPPIQITVCEGTHDIVFRISDRGGGIDPETEKHLWSYAQQSNRFANFEKVSRMAATVQEQLVSPNRRSLSSQDDGSGSEDEAEEGGISELQDSEDGSVILPPPPSGWKGNNHERNNNNRAKPNATLQLDGRVHEQERNRKQQLSSTISPISASKKASEPRMIDPKRQNAQLAAKKPGHLDPKARQDTAVHLGIGLPMSKVYAEYWGGDLKVFTMHGYGTDAYAKFCKFGNIYENFNV